MTNQSEAARLIASKRKSYEGICERCGATFSGLQSKRYCSKNCGVAAWQKANRARRQAAGKDNP